MEVTDLFIEKSQSRFAYLLLNKKRVKYHSYQCHSTDAIKLLEWKPCEYEYVRSGRKKEK